MHNRLRRSLIRLLLRSLLLAVCFHAGAGVALHEARHFDALARLAAQAPDTDTTRGAEAPVEDAHSLCAWCTAFAAQVAHAGAPPGVPAAVQTGTMRHAVEAAGIVARPLRWSFAARDPPVSKG